MIDNKKGGYKLLKPPFFMFVFLKKRTKANSYNTF